MSSIQNLYNNAYSSFTPDFVSSKNLSKLENYFYENNRSLREFIESYVSENNIFPTTVAEMGCGAGGMAPFLTRIAPQYIGIDFSTIAVSIAKEYNQLKNNPADFVCADLTDNTFSMASTDLLIDSHLLHCLVGERRKNYFELVRQSMHKDSLFLIETMVFDKAMQFPVGYRYSEDCVLYKEFKGEELPIRSIFSGRQIEEELLLMGFSIKYLYFHREVTMNPFDEYPDYDARFLPHVCRIALQLPR